MKARILFALLFLSLVPALALVGCSTATSPDATTTTTTTSTTSTTSSTPIGSITGAVTLPGLEGNLWVGATTDSTFTTTEGWVEIDTQVSSGDATYDYVLPIYTAGTYYVLGMVSVGTTETRETPLAGDRLGEYADGGMPWTWGQTPIGTPAPIYVTSGAETAKNFELKVTWN